MLLKFPAVVNAIAEGSVSGWNAESACSARNLLTCITNFDFIMSFVVANKCLNYIKGLTVSLQKKAKDICQAYAEVKTVQAALNQVCEKIDVEHKAWFTTAVALGQKVHAADPKLPRRCSRQTGRNNTPGDTPEIYFKRAISIPFVDSLLTHIESRFSDIQQKALMAMKIVPSVLMDAQSKLDELLEYYADDIPNPSILEAELHLWKCKWATTPSSDLPDTPAKALKKANESIFPNIHQLLRIICTIPVSSCECERSISVLRRLKTYLRSSMGQERLSGLALMHINYSMEIDLDEVINIFARKHPRRMALADILTD